MRPLSEIRRLARPILALGFSAVLPTPTPAAPAHIDANLNVRRLTTRDGLPAAVVYCIFQDSRGFVWFGTADGIARYDSHEFRTFAPDHGDPESLANGGVLAIAEDEAGNLWFATEGGLDLWHRDTERFSHVQNDPANPTSLSDNTTQCLLRNPDGTLWVGTTRGGLNLYDPATGVCTRFEPRPGAADWLNDPWIRCLARDSRGLIWIGTGDGGLTRLDPSTRTFHTYRHDPDDPASLSHDRVSAIVEDREGALWVGTDRGLCRLDRERTRFERWRVAENDTGALPVGRVAALTLDSEGHVWVGTDGGGVSVLDPGSGTFQHHRHSTYAANTLASNAVRALYEDSVGDMWIGHFPAGVSHFNRLSAPFSAVQHVPGEANSLADDNVLAFVEDETGELWVGTDNGGLNHWDPRAGRWTAYRHSGVDAASLGGKAAVAILRDSAGELWVGSWDGGLNRFDPSTGTFRRYPALPGRLDGITDPDVWQIAEDNSGGLWLATIGGGVCRYDRARDVFDSFEHDPADPRSLNDNIASALLITRDGTLWVGTPRGLARWQPGTRDWDRFQTAPNEPGALNNYWIFDLLEDSEGYVWATTEGGGLNRLDPRTGRSEVFTVAHGFPSNVMRGMLQDDAGDLWIGTNRGLVRFDPQTRSVRIFDESNGLPGTQFNPHARLRLQSGEFLFGTTEGFVRFDPRTVGSNTTVPAVALTGFEVFNQPVVPARDGSVLPVSISEIRQLQLPAALSVISFQFAALSYRSAEHTEYSFKLEGFERDWRKPGPERRATYTNLDPGRYVLRVNAANADGVWNEQGVALELIVVPPWWRTWWFRSGATLAVLGTAATIGSRISARRLREIQREEQLATERERARERDRAAEAVRRSERELHLILNSIPAMVWYKDTRNRILGVNQAAARLERAEPEQLVGRSCHELYPPDMADSVYRDDLEVVRSGKPRLGVEERHVVHGTDDERWLDVSRVPVFDAAGTVKSLIVFAIDITERRRAEDTIRALNASLEERVSARTRELAESEARFRMLFETMLQGVIHQDTAGRIIFMNPAAERILGYSHEELTRVMIERQPAGVIEEDGSPVHQEQYPSSVALRTGREVRNAVLGIINGRDGRRRWVSITAVPLFHPESPTPYQAYTIFDDITDRREAERQIRRQTDIVAGINSIFHETLTSDSDEQVARVFLNVCARLTGSRDGCVVERHGGRTHVVGGICSPSGVASAATPAGWCKALESDTAVVENDAAGTFPPPSPAGPEPTRTRFLTVPLLEGRTLIGNVGLIGKLTDYVEEDRIAIEAVAPAYVEALTRRRAQRSIDQLNRELTSRAQALEQANRELESFSYSVSHDLRTPLRSIDGFSRILLDEHGSKLEPDAAECLQMVRSSTQRMGQLIDDLLRLAKVARAEMLVVDHDLSKVAEDVVKELRTAHPDRDVTVEIEPGLTARGDVRLMRIVLDNLLGNAWKFTGRVPSGHIRFGRRATRGTHAFFVSDNGVGFEPQYMSKLFNAFQRLHSADEFPGTGIGLATVQRIIHRHGGSVWAESLPGQGATFYFSLPA